MITCTRFYLSGRYWDKGSEYSDARHAQRRSDKALLFRLGLKAGQSVAYLFDLGDELRHTISVVSVSDVEAPLARPVVVEAIGEAPPQCPHLADDVDDVDDVDDEAAPDGATSTQSPSTVPPKLVPLLPLAEAVLTMVEQLDLLDEDNDDRVEIAELTRSLVLKLATAALCLAEELKEDEALLDDLHYWFGDRDLAPRLLDLHWRLADVGETARAVAVARAYGFLVPDLRRGDLAIIFARGGQRERALEELKAYLEAASDICRSQVQAGDVYEALGEAGSAQAHYEKALAAATTRGERVEVIEHIAFLLVQTGRQDEADALVARERDRIRGARPPEQLGGLARVGRNEPCPCGSNKKYKKCTERAEAPAMRRPARRQGRGLGTRRSTRLLRSAESPRVIP